jgi:hypothetical protein
MWPVLAAVTALGGCSEHKLGGNLTVNGTASPVAGCRTSAAETWGEVILASGARLRMIDKPKSGSGDGQYRFELYPADGAGSRGIDLACNRTSHSWRNINGRISGSATIDCTAPGTTVKGSFSFGSCGG